MIQNNEITKIMNHIHGKSYTKNILIHGKERKIHIYTDKDQEIHKLASNILWEDYQKKINPNCYAYVRGRSCIDAVSKANKKVKDFECYIKTDIKNFFPSINIKLLTEMLIETYDKNFVNKILSFVSLETGGISQGSSLSPILSNIYLINFDRIISSKACYFRIQMICFCFVIKMNTTIL